MLRIPIDGLMNPFDLASKNTYVHNTHPCINEKVEEENIQHTLILGNL